MIGPAFGLAKCVCRKPRPYTVTYHATENGKPVHDETEMCERCGGVIRDWHPVQTATEQGVTDGAKSHH